MRKTKTKEERPAERCLREVKTKGRNKMADMQKAFDEVRKMLSGEQSGHGVDHVERVYRLALELAEKEGADKEIAGLAALLHDCDDYKLAGEEAAEKLPNARRILAVVGAADDVREKVLEIIARMGYAKSLKGVRPSSLEGKVVSDADMLDAIGVCGIIRCLQYALVRCNAFGTPLFDPAVWPEPGLSAEEYKRPNRKSDNFINHFFEKLLKLKAMMMTASAREEAEIRHRAMTDFLYHFFRERKLTEWSAYLDAYSAAGGQDRGGKGKYRGCR